MAIIGLLTLSLHIGHAQSLKDKRQVVRSLKERLRHRHNVSIAETGHQDTWQRAEISIVTVSGDHDRAEEVLRQVEHEAEDLLGGQLASAEMEFL